MADDKHITRELNENEARELSAKIYGHLDIAWDLVTKAYYGRADKALGYASWDDYCQGEFEGAWIRLPRDKRRGVVATLQEAGLSQRAIASAVGMSQPTIAGDIKAGDQNLSPPERPKIIIDGTFTETLPADERPKVQATKDTRPPLIKKADAAGWELRKAIEKISDVLIDESYSDYRDQVKLSLEGAIEFAQSVLSEHSEW